MALPLPLARLLTTGEFAALPEDGDGRYELQEGAIVMAPRPRPDHQMCLGRLLSRLEEQVPAELEVLPEVDLDLQLVAGERPGTVRVPDLVVAGGDARRRVRGGEGLLRASDAQLVVEIVSPGSRRLDTIVKAGEYADAGIPHYWVVDLEDHASLVTFRYPGAAGYSHQEQHTGVVTLDQPFAVRIDLDGLR